MEQNKLTEGPIVGTLLRLAIPIVASSFLSTAYNIMDMAWVGTLGSKVVAGVGVGGMYIWLSSGFSIISRMGGQVHAAQSIGGEDQERARKYARAAIQMTVFFGLLFAALSLIFTRQMVGFFNLHDEVAESVARGYIRVTCGLIIFSFMNITLTGLYTAQGDSKTPLKANFIGLVLNMILDPLLILGVGFFPKLGGLGAAIATVLSQAIVTGVLILLTRKRESLLFYDQNYLILEEKDYYQNIFRTGFPMAIQSSVYCFISMVLSRIVADFGAEAVAVVRVGGQIEAVTWNMADGFGSAMNAFCGQNYGGKRYDRIKKGFHFSLATTFAWGSMVFLAFRLAPEAISSVFFHEQLAFDMSVVYLTNIAFCEPFMAVELVNCGALAGLGKTRLCSIISIVVTSLRIPLAYVLHRTSLGIVGIWWAMNITSILKGILFTVVLEMWIRKRNR